MVEEYLVEDKDAPKVAKALASQTRWNILKILTQEKLDVSRIAKRLNQTEANISAQVKILENANLITSNYEPGLHGVRKVCEPKKGKVIFQIYK
ncbi:MAG: ArsR/SmtB family transcription factor [Candidatus Ranarchaeia archaeon]